MLLQTLSIGRKSEIMDILADALDLCSGFFDDAIVIDTTDLTIEQAVAMAAAAVAARFPERTIP